MSISDASKEIMEERLKLLYKLKNEADTRLAEACANKSFDEREFKDTWDSMTLDEKNMPSGMQFKGDFAKLLQQHNDSIRQDKERVKGYEAEIRQAHEYLRRG